MRNIIKKALMIFTVATLLIASLAGCGQSGLSGGGGKARILMTLHDDTDTFLISLVEAMDKKASSM